MLINYILFRCRYVIYAYCHGVHHPFAEYGIIIISDMAKVNNGTQTLIKL